MPTGALIPPVVKLPIVPPLLVKALTLPALTTQMSPALSNAMLFGVLNPLPLYTVPVVPVLLSLVIVALPLLVTQALPLASMAMAEGALIGPAV